MKNKKAQAANAIVIGVIGVVIGVAMIPILASLIDDGQVLQVVAIEQLTTTTANTTVTLNNLKVSSGTFNLINSTSTADILRSGLEYTIDERSSKVKIINRTGTFNASYRYEPTTYVETATGRTVIKQVTLMYAVGMLILTLGAVGIAVFNRKS